MKPHIAWSVYFRDWQCSLPGGRSYQAVGVGKTPAAAYAEWMMRNAGMEAC